MPLASSDHAISREEIIRIAAHRAAEKYATEIHQVHQCGGGVWDANAARQLGWKFIGIASGEQADRLRQAGAEIIIPDYRSAKAFVRASCERSLPPTIVLDNEAEFASLREAVDILLSALCRARMNSIITRTHWTKAIHYGFGISALDLRSQIGLPNPFGVGDIRSPGCIRHRVNKQ